MKRAVSEIDHIIFPMITSVEEVRQAKEVCGKVREKLKQQGIPFRSDVELGIMVNPLPRQLSATTLCMRWIFQRRHKRSYAIYPCDRPAKLQPVTLLQYIS